jgi:hypothetical protein
MDIADYQCPGLPCAAARHAMFVGGREHRHLFVDRRRTAQVALLWSVPSLVWRRFSSLSIGPRLSPPLDIQFANYFTGIARVMEDAHILYEVLMLGHSDLFDDSASTTRINPDTLSTMVLAGVDAISDSHVAILSKFVRSGGHLIMVGAAVGSADEELRPRCAPAFSNLTAHPGKGRVSQIADVQMLQYLGGEESTAFGQIASVLRPVSPLMETTLPASVRINMFRHGGGPMSSMTMTNYGDSAASGTVSLPVSALKCQNCSLFFHDLPLLANGSVVSLDGIVSTDRLHISVNVTVSALAVLLALDVKIILTPTCIFH